MSTPHLLYSLLYAVLMPVILLRLLWRSRLAPAYRQRWLERFGIFTAPALDKEKPVIWLHAVSVGETLAAVPLVKRLQERHPDWQWVVTTTTPTGSERARATLGNSAFHVYAAYDLPVFLNNFLSRVHPSLCIIMETELWPNMLRACTVHKIPVLIANARLSENSARGYKKIAPLTRRMLGDVSCLAAQQSADAQRFLQLGMAPERMHITGSIKFDLDINPSVKEKAAVLREQWSCGETRKVWLVASTHPGEDEIILEAFADLKKSFPDLLLVLVPRHPERFHAVTRQCLQANWNVLTRSSHAIVDANTDIVVGDSMGELLVFYGTADMAFVGGSLVPVGGHNLIEPAAWACPFVSGPHLFNFSEIARLLQDDNAVAIASDSKAIAECLSGWLHDDAARKNAGLRARQIVDANRGALHKLVILIEQTLVGQVITRD
ncbi:MAG TPA: lipid IV(A) 3-deoxy-D-manno-octulosonic acid transferase [Pseudomonadales bacterium]|nr:lipid IV(A) 3-deoxy-D-manno-octulosonic acid transferase [Pseudomonadales bacterium]